MTKSQTKKTDTKKEENKVTAKKTVIKEEIKEKEPRKIKFSELRKEGRDFSRNQGKAGTLFLIGLIIIGLSFIFGMIDGAICGALGIESDNILSNIVINIVSIIFTIGIISFLLDLINGIDAKVKNFWEGMTRDRIWKGVLGSFLTTIYITIGLICLIIPGIILCVRLRYVLYAVIDKGMDPIEAISYSWHITKGHFREIIGFDFYFLFFDIIGFLCLIVGLIWTSAMRNIARTRYYRLLSEQYEYKKNNID